MHLNTRALSSAQDYLSPPNKGGDTDAHRGIGEAKPDAWKRQVQEEIDSAAQDTVKWPLHIIIIMFLEIQQYIHNVQTYS